MIESPNKRAVLVGLFVLTGLVFLLAGVLIVGNLRETFKRKMNVVSLFDDVSGLQPGNNIWLSGVKIGTVEKLKFYGKSQVEVSMSIDTKARQFIPKDSKVKISNDGFIGNKILVIYGGTEKSLVVQEGDTLGVAKTFTSEDVIATLQENNKNLLAITTDLKNISKKIASGEGTIGKLLTDTSVYVNIEAATKSLQEATIKAQQLIGSLALFSSSLNKKGSLINELVSDTVVFKSVKSSVLQLQQTADTTTVFLTNLKQASANPNSAIGVLLHDSESGTRLKETLKNLESSSIKLNEDLEAAQHNFLLRGYFRKKAKNNESNLPEK